MLISQPANQPSCGSGNSVTFLRGTESNSHWPYADRKTALEKTGCWQWLVGMVCNDADAEFVA